MSDAVYAWENSHVEVYSDELIELGNAMQAELVARIAFLEESERLSELVIGGQQKTIAELEAENGRLKCCGNCGRDRSVDDCCDDCTHDNSSWTARAEEARP